MKPAERHPFFEPLWRRIAILVFVAAWLIFEIVYTRDPLWITVAAAILVYGVWSFLIAWPKGSPPA